VVSKNTSAAMMRASCILLIGFFGSHCVPSYPPDSVDLSMIQIGQSRTQIESTLGIRAPSRLQVSRVVVLYNYGPGSEGARRAAEADVPCLPSVGGRIACAIQGSFYGALADSSVAELQGSLLQVIYDAEGVAEWVVFGSTSRELAKANEIINGAEAGDADAALLVGRSLSQGTNGFQIDSINAYKWLSIAVRLGAEGAPSERKRVGARLSPEKRKLVDRRVDDGSF
jgi:hypothetical protein